MSSDSMEDDIRTFADAPEERRRVLVMLRLKLIAQMPEEHQVKALRAIMVAGWKLAPEKRKEFIATRTAVISDAPTALRQTIQVARVKAGSIIPATINQSDMMDSMEATRGWPEEKRQFFMNELEEVFRKLGLAMPDLGTL